MKKPNLQRLAQRSKIYLRKASPTILSGLGAAGVIVTSVIQRLIANLKLLNQHGSAIFRQQLAVRQRYSASSVPMC